MTDKNTRQHYKHKKMKGKHGLEQTVHERETCNTLVSKQFNITEITNDCNND